MKNVCLLLFLLMTCSPLFAQSIRITGNVTDESGDSLPGVNVIEKGTTNGTVTDIEGNFAITVASAQSSLQFSFIGMDTEEIPVGGQRHLSVILKTSSIEMQDLVVVGYGVQRKSDVISSVVSVNTEQATKVPTVDIGEMLRGKATGVYVTLADAAPGSSSNILIRGSRSLTAGNAPIVIADGVPVGGINDINPNDIESIEILKDAAAQAIYGARASNGVILITTKRAKEGVTRIDYNGYYGMQTVKRNFDVYSGEEFAQLKREAYRADNNNNYGNYIRQYPKIRGNKVRSFSVTY